MPSSSHRGVWVLLLVAVVLAVLRGPGGAVPPPAAAPGAPALSASAGSVGARPGDGAADAADGRQAAPRGAAAVSLPAPGGPAGTGARAEDPGPGAVSRAVDAGSRRCAPAQQGPDGTPGVPARAGAHAEHCVAAGSRSVPWGGAAPGAAPRAAGPVPAHGRPAPGPVELSVMRV